LQILQNRKTGEIPYAFNAKKIKNDSTVKYEEKPNIVYVSNSENNTYETP